jgi:hypothetical protein
MVIPRLYGAPVWRWHHQHRWCPYGYQPALPLHATRVAGNCTHAMLSHTTVFLAGRAMSMRPNETSEHARVSCQSQWIQKKIINFVWKYIWWGIVGRFLEWVGAPRADLTPWLTLNHGCLPPNEWILSELLFSRSGPDLMWQQCLELNLKTKESNHFNISISGDLDMLDV